MSGRQHPGWLAILFIVMLTAWTPARGATGVSAVGAHFTRAAWDVGTTCGGKAADPRQTVAGVWVDLGLGGGLSARLESSGAAARSAGTELELGDNLSGAVVLGYEPPTGPWRLQAGVGTPSGGELTREERGLLRMLAEPGLCFPVEAPARGWQIHVSVLGGVALQRGLGLYGGAAIDWPAAYEVTSGEKLRPGARLLALAGLEAGDERRGAGLQLSLAFDGRQRLDGREVCGPRTVWGAGASGRTIWRALRGEAGVQMTASEGLRWPSDTELMLDVRSDPAHRWDFSVVLGLDHGFEVVPGWRLRPLVRATYRRFLPAGLPYGDGWTDRIMPGLELSAGRLQIEASAGWGRGGWRAACGEARGPRQEIEGSVIQLGVQWLAMPAPARSGRAPSR